VKRNSGLNAGEQTSLCFLHGDLHVGRLVLSIYKLLRTLYGSLAKAGQT